MSRPTVAQVKRLEKRIAELENELLCSIRTTNMITSKFEEYKERFSHSAFIEAAQENAKVAKALAWMAIKSNPKEKQQ